MEGEPALHPMPVSWEQCKHGSGDMCVAVEMTLAIHISNDLKQFTWQLKQDLSCDNPEEIVTKRQREGGGKWISLLRSALVAPACCAWFCLQCRVPRLLPQKPKQVGIKFTLYFASLLSSSVVVLRTSIQRAPSVRFSLMRSATRCGVTQCQYVTIHHCFTFPTYKSLPQDQV